MGVEVWYFVFVSTQMSFDEILHVRVTTKYDGQVLLLLFMPVSKVMFLLFPGFVNNIMSFTMIIINNPRFAGFSSAASERIPSKKMKSKIFCLQITIAKILKQYRGLEALQIKTYLKKNTFLTEIFGIVHYHRLF